METSFVVILINVLKSVLITTLFWNNLTMSIDAISFFKPIFQIDTITFRALEESDK